MTHVSIKIPLSDFVWPLNPTIGTDFEAQWTKKDVLEEFIIML